MGRGKGEGGREDALLMYVKKEIKIKEGKNQERREEERERKKSRDTLFIILNWHIK